MKFLLVLWLALLAGACATTPRVLPENAHGDRPTQVDGFIRELTLLEVHYADGSSQHLDTLITRPDRAGQFPLLLMIHGTPRDSSERATMSPTSTSGKALFFARRGYAVAQVMRRAYGRSTGAYAEDSGPCQRKDYGPGVRASGDDVIAALLALHSESWVDPSRVILLGVSTGGLAVVAAAARNPSGVLGAISFAGGRGSPAPDQVCSPAKLVQEEGTLGRTGRVPELWIYAENDHYFAPGLAQQLAGAYTAAGGVAQLVVAPPFAEDGHMLFHRAPVDRWWIYVEPFLRGLQLPTEDQRPRSEPGVALPADAYPKLRAGFAQYLDQENYEKAFAIGDGCFGWAAGKRTRTEAAEEALRNCRKHGTGCSLFAIGEAPVR